ncbi:MAG: hypothetical protein LBF25_01940, partial [Puniceicoccales bacterium]|nr:hypothetical protein [Puniceicoccales bacterium]
MGLWRMSSPKSVSNLQPTFIGGEDPFVRTTKWVLHTGAADQDWKSKTTKTLFSKTSISERDAAVDNPTTSDDLDPERIASALEQVKCSLAPKPDAGAMDALLNFLKRLEPHPDDLRIDGKKISYKNLQISVMSGPNGPEVSISYSGSIDNPEQADRQLEDFVGLLRGRDEFKDEAVRRTLTIGETVIGLPMKNVFTQGIRYKVLEHRGEKRVILGQPCVDGLRNVADGNGTMKSFIDSGTKKIIAYNSYVETISKEKFSNETVGNLAKDERKAALTGGELEHLITLLRNKGKETNVPQLSRSWSVSLPDIFSIEPSEPPRAELQRQLAAQTEANTTLRGQVGDLTRQNRTLTEERDTARNENKRLTEQNAAQAKANTTLTGQLDETGRKLTEQTEANAGLQGQNRILTGRVKNLEAENAAQAEANRTLTGQVTGLEGQVGDLTGQNRDLTEQLENLHSENELQSSQLEQLQNKLQGKADEAERLSSELKQLQRELSAAQGEHARLEAEIAELEVNLNDLKSVLIEQVDRSTELELENEQLKKKIT